MCDQANTSGRRWHHAQGRQPAEDFLGPRTIMVHQSTNPMPYHARVWSGYLAKTFWKRILPPRILLRDPSFSFRERGNLPGRSGLWMDQPLLRAILAGRLIRFRFP